MFNFSKTAIFQDYNTLRLQNNCIETHDSETIRVNPLTGEKLAYTQNNVNTTISNAYVELLLHASSFYTVFNDISIGNSITDKEINRNAALEYRKLENNDTSNIVQNVIDDRKIRDAPFSHMQEDITRMKLDPMRDPLNVSKRIHDERWRNDENDELEALDLTQKRTKLNF
ncbi:unnamed protein product [Onchocerca flexuosa]|uniref:Uncharacterized protein n=1 Tax=Onchocerca flexuosa TaxID=387005 RepID=A0A3P7WV68_9BILA|nr:unnamed protein product [Onchocerca flexuosa]